MAKHGVFEDRLDGAIFADTQWEPPQVYKHLDWLETQLPFPVYRVTKGSLLQGIYSRKNTSGGRYASIPWYIMTPSGGHGIGRRQCTREYKLEPIANKIRDLLGASRHSRIHPGTVEQWIGISLDEATRMKPARQKYLTSRWPLIERNMTRSDCLSWLREHGYPEPPKSACIGCPFHSKEMWLRMRSETPELFAHACEVDAVLRIGNARGIRGEEFMHSKRIPLAAAVESYKDDGVEDALNPFENECEGMCGV